MFTFEITEEIAKQILEAEDCCYGEGFTKIPNSLMCAIKEHFPDLAKKYDFLY